MYQYQYTSGNELLALIRTHGLRISEIALLHEAEREEADPARIVSKMRETLWVMQTNIRNGMAATQPSIGGLIGKNAHAMGRYLENSQPYSGVLLGRAAAYALAVTEENARMKRIVTCPTAGACGVVPACLKAAQEVLGWTEQQVLDGLFNASAIGVVIARNATISGAEGGCQAEVGAAAAMAASALTELAGGSAQACFAAAAMALKNMMGLVCDPVAGLVEVPCSKRNVGGAANAVTAADMALAGIESPIPFDEVVHAMKEVGAALPRELRETARGGVADTRTARKITDLLGVHS